MVIDIIVLAVLFVSALISFIRGFVRETLTILGVTGGLAAAYYGGPVLSPAMRNALGVKEGAEPERLFGLVPYPIVADILSYGLIFLAIVIVLSIVSHILAETVRAVGLGAIDRTLGIVFGIARGLLLLSVLYLPFHLSLDKETKDKWFEGSKTRVMLETMADVLTEYLPDSTVKQIKDSAASVGDSAAKQKLLQIDLLKDESKTPANATPPAPADHTTGGYSDDFRHKMDEMFQTGTPTPHEVKPAPQAVPQEPPQPPEQPAGQP